MALTTLKLRGKSVRPEGNAQAFGAALRLATAASGKRCSMPRALQLLVLAAAGLAAPALVSTWIEDAQTRSLIATAALVSVVGFLATAWLVPQVRCVRRGNPEPV